MVLDARFARSLPLATRQVFRVKIGFLGYAGAATSLSPPNLTCILKVRSIKLKLLDLKSSFLWPPQFIKQG